MIVRLGERQRHGNSARFFASGTDNRIGTFLNEIRKWDTITDDNAIESLGL